MKNTLRDPKLLADQLRMAISNVVYVGTPHVSARVQELMSDSLTAFVIEAVEKYEQGQVEHGGDLRDRNHREEIAAETIDLFWYTAAANWPKDTDGKIQKIHSRSTHID